MLGSESKIDNKWTARQIVGIHLRRNRVLGIDETKGASMIIKDLFPLALITLNLGAMITSSISKDYSKSVYWFAAALLNCSVAFPQIFKP